MNTDNGIYIGRFLDEDGGYFYCVIEAQAIENCNENDMYLYSYYKDGVKFRDEHYAWRYAAKLSKQYDVLEYGVSLIIYDKVLTDGGIVEETVKTKFEKDTDDSIISNNIITGPTAAYARTAGGTSTTKG